MNSNETNRAEQRAETFRTAAVLFDDSLYGYPERPNVRRPQITGRRVG